MLNIRSPVPTMSSLDSRKVSKFAGSMGSNTIRTDIDEEERGNTFLSRPIRSNVLTPDESSEECEERSGDHSQVLPANDYRDYNIECIKSLLSHKIRLLKDGESAPPTPRNKYFLALELSFNPHIINEAQMSALLRESQSEISLIVDQYFFSNCGAQILEASKMRVKLSIDAMPFHTAKRFGLNLHELPKDDERRMALQALFLFILRPHIPVKYANTEKLLEAYPDFADLPEIEIGRLKATANWMDLAFYTIAPRNSKTFLMSFIPRICEGRAVRYITGSGETRATSDRVIIYRKEGNCDKIERPPRKRGVASEAAVDNNLAMANLSEMFEGGGDSAQQELKFNSKKLKWAETTHENPLDTLAAPATIPFPHGPSVVHAATAAGADGLAAGTGEGTLSPPPVNSWWTSASLPNHPNPLAEVTSTTAKCTRSILDLTHDDNKSTISPHQHQQHQQQLQSSSSISSRLLRAALSPSSMPPVLTGVEDPNMMTLTTANYHPPHNPLSPSHPPHPSQSPVQARALLHTDSKNGGGGDSSRSDMKATLHTLSSSSLVGPSSTSSSSSRPRRRREAVKEVKMVKTKAASHLQDQGGCGSLMSLSLAYDARAGEGRAEKGKRDHLLYYPESIASMSQQQRDHHYLQRKREQQVPPSPSSSRSHASASASAAISTGTKKGRWPVVGTNQKQQKPQRGHHPARPGHHRSTSSSSLPHPSTTHFPVPFFSSSTSAGAPAPPSAATEPDVCWLYTVNSSPSQSTQSKLQSPPTPGSFPSPENVSQSTSSNVPSPRGNGDDKILPSCSLVGDPILSSSSMRSQQQQHQQRPSAFLANFLSSMPSYSSSSSSSSSSFPSFSNYPSSSSYISSPFGATSIDAGGGSGCGLAPSSMMMCNNNSTYPTSSPSSSYSTYSTSSYRNNPSFASTMTSSSSSSSSAVLPSPLYYHNQTISATADEIATAAAILLSDHHNHHHNQQLLQPLPLPL